MDAERMDWNAFVRDLSHAVYLSCTDRSVLSGLRRYPRSEISAAGADRNEYPLSSDRGLCSAGSGGGDDHLAAFQIVPESAVFSGAR